MPSFFTSHWRVVSAFSLVLTAIAIVAVLRFADAGFQSEPNAGFTLIGSSMIFVFTYFWPYIVSKVEGLNRRLAKAPQNPRQLGIKFFFWVALIAFPFVAFESIVPTVDSDLAFGVAACTGLVSGCSSILARTKQKLGEQVGDGDAEEAV